MTASIGGAFAAAKRTLLVPYLTACWPQAESFSKLLLALERGGADMIEIGIPFSDPTADGYVIQQANDEAIANGIDLYSTLTQINDYRERGGSLPVILMGYANSFLRYGTARLACDCEKNQINGILAVDWPPGKGDGLGEHLAGREIDRIVLLSPSTTIERAKHICELGSGYAYYVSIQGVTGATSLDTEAVINEALRLRGQLNLPLAVGFGVRTAEDCARLSKFFDAVIVGTQLIKSIRSDPENATDVVMRLLLPMREALG